MIQGTITKTGNSYAIRVPKRYIIDNGLQLGDKVELEDPLARQRAALAALEDRLDAFPDIKDPVAWQREQRAWSDPWEEIGRDTTR